MAVIAPNNTIKGAMFIYRVTTVPDATTYVGAPRGALLTNITTGVLYSNTGTAAVPVWTAQA